MTAQSAREAMKGTKYRPESVRYEDTNWRPKTGGLGKPFLPLSVLYCIAHGRTTSIDCPLVTRAQVEELREQYGAAEDYFWNSPLPLATRIDLIATQILVDDRRATRQKNVGKKGMFSSWDINLPSQYVSRSRMLPWDPDELEYLLLEPRCHRVRV